MVARLQRRTHFSHIRAHGTTVREGRLRITGVRPDNGQEPAGAAIAFAIPRSYGSAVRRNRARRRLRAIANQLERDDGLPPGWFLVNVMSSASEPDHSQLQTWFVAATQKLRPAIVGRT